MIKNVLDQILEILGALEGSSTPDNRNHGSEAHGGGTNASSVNDAEKLVPVENPSYHDHDTDMDRDTMSKCHFLVLLLSIV